MLEGESKNETKCFSMRMGHLGQFLEYQRSPTHMQGALALSIHIAGSIAALYGSF
jgi:hypothetical protein